MRAIRLSPAETARTGVIAALAASAGAHGALVPAHLVEEPRLGVAFAVAAILAVAASVMLAMRPSGVAVWAAALLFAGLIAAYAINVTTGLPWLSDGTEPVDAVGLATKAAEAIGLSLALHLTLTTGGRRSLLPTEARP